MANEPTPAWLAVQQSFIKHNDHMHERRPYRERFPEHLLVVIGSARCSYWCGQDPGDEVMPGWCYLESNALRMTKEDAAGIMVMDKNNWAWRFMMIVQFDPDKPGLWLPTANGWPFMV